MKPRTLFAAGLALAIAAMTADARAHDASQHKGATVHGTVTEVTADQLTLKTQEGESRTFALAPETVVERGDRKAAVADIAVGEEAAVFGTKLPGGKTAASEVVIGGEAGGGKCGADSHGTHERLR